MDSGELILKYEQLISQNRITHWVDSELFTLKWWISLLALLIPWFIWYRMVAKDRIIENLVYGFLISIAHLTLDEVVTEFSLLAYTIKLAPIFPRSIVFNYSIIPFIFMLVYQYFPGWKAYTAGSIIAGGIYSFILMPLLVWTNFVVLIKWNHFYTFLAIVSIAIITKVLMKITNAVEIGNP